MAVDLMTWRKNAACKGVDPDLFFPGDKNPGLEAKAVCNTCKAKQPCLAFALKNEEPGVWGGTTQKDRAQIRRKLRRSR